jgi:hypothetical protein
MKRSTFLYSTTAFSLKNPEVMQILLLAAFEKCR